MGSTNSKNGIAIMVLASIAVIHVLYPIYKSLPYMFDKRLISSNELYMGQNTNYNERRRVSSDDGIRTL